MFSQAARATRSCTESRRKQQFDRSGGTKDVHVRSLEKFYEQEWAKETTSGLGSKVWQPQAFLRQKRIPSMQLQSWPSLCWSSPYGPTGNLLWLPFLHSRRKALKDRETYDTVEMRVPSGKKGGDTIEVQNPHVPGVVFKCAVPLKGRRDAFKMKLLKETLS